MVFIHSYVYLFKWFRIQQTHHGICISFRTKKITVNKSKSRSRRQFKKIAVQLAFSSSQVIPHIGLPIINDKRSSLYSAHICQVSFLGKWIFLNVINIGLTWNVSLSLGGQTFINLNDNVFGEHLSRINQLVKAALMELLSCERDLLWIPAYNTTRVNLPISSLCMYVYIYIFVLRIRVYSI